MNKTERLTIKITVPDKQAIQRIADAEGESVAAVVRRLIRQAVAARELQSNGRVATRTANLCTATSE